LFCISVGSKSIVGCKIANILFVFLKKKQ